VSEGLILGVDDEPQILRALTTNLRGAGYDVVRAATGEEALAAAAVRPPDAVVLDLVLPDISGVEVCRELRTWSEMPIVILSAVGEEGQKVQALDAGADDYVTKPFGMDELLARLRAAVRRATPASAAAEPVVTTADFTIDLSAKRVTLARDGSDVRLTPTEWQLLEVLARHPDRLVTQRQLLQEVWGPGYLTEANYLRVYVANLRRKLEPSPSRPRYLRTEAGMGYRFCPSGAPGGQGAPDGQGAREAGSGRG
jgi:two-component system KDP operon response regulator KdpE